jgi:hypothetical protein
MTFRHEDVAVPVEREEERLLALGAVDEGGLAREQVVGADAEGEALLGHRRAGLLEQLLARLAIGRHVRGVEPPRDQALLDVQDEIPDGVGSGAGGAGHGRRLRQSHPRAGRCIGNGHRHGKGASTARQ